MIFVMYIYSRKNIRPLLMLIHALMLEVVVSSTVHHQGMTSRVSAATALFSPLWTIKRVTVCLSDPSISMHPFLGNNARKTTFTEVDYRQEE